MVIYVRDKSGVLQTLKIPAYTGEKGEAGITPNIQIGDVITLESGQQATVVRRGDDENPIFDFAIPKGEDGKDGIFVGSVDDAPEHAQIVINDDPSPYDLFYEDANVSYMGDTYTSLKEKADADIEYLLRKFGTQHYEGANITATDTYAKQVKQAELKGQTLVNHCPSSIYKNESWSVGVYKTYSDFPTLIKGKTYTFYAPLGSKNGNPADALINLFITTDNTNKGIYHTYSNSHDTILKTFTMGDRLRFENFSITGERFQQNYPMVMILEGEWTSETLPGYFEGMKSVKAPTVKTVGKNLFDIANSSNGYFSLSNPYGLAGPDFSNKTSAYIKVKPNTQYSYSFDGFAQSQVGNLYWTGFYYYKRVGEVSTVHPSRMTFTGVNQISFTTPSDCNYIRIGSRGLMLDGATVQLEESTTATTYKPYTSSSLTLPEEVILRSLPNGVCDTYNTRTGEYVRRIGEIMLDDTLFYEHAWGGERDTETDYIAGVKVVNHLWNKHNDLGGHHFICNKLRTRGITSFNGYGYFLFYVNKSILGNEVTRAKIREYILSLNAIVQYELATPIITTVDLQNQKIYSYDGTTYYTTASADGHPAPILSIDVPTNTTKMIARQREEIEQQEQKLQEQEEVQNALIESQLAWYEQTILLDDNQKIPSHIQKLYEVAYERGIRTKEGEL